MRTRVLAGLVAVVGLGLAACGGSDDAPAPSAQGGSTSSSPAPSGAAPSSPTSSSAAPDPGALQYVALGDSYAAAPGVPNSDEADGCYRSDHNYAHLVALADPSIQLTDVTCSGATSDDVVGRQVPSLTADTDLVTIGIGGNDAGIFVGTLSQCLGKAGESGAPCTAGVEGMLDGALPSVEAGVGRVLDAIEKAAPDARVIVVGYPALLPESGSCPDLVPIADGDYPALAAVNQGLSDVLRKQADQRGLDYVDVYAASSGHDVCSDDPWVNGMSMGADGTIPFHPFAEEQAAVAAMIADVL